MIHIFAIMILTALWVLVQRLVLHQTITWVEMLLQAVGALVIVSTVFFLGSYSQTSALEVWNGQITGRHDDLRSWRCNCVCMARNSDGFCTNEVCQTCYRRDYYFDTNLPSDILYGSTRGRSYNPARAWLNMPIGSPASQLVSYQNWVRAASSSLFHEEALAIELYGDLIPPYPDGIPGNSRMQYYPDRVIAVGASVPDLAQWNSDLANILRHLGPEHEANVIVMITDEPSRDFAQATWAAWQGGNKNDIFLTIGVDGNRIAWTHVESWADTEAFNVRLRDDVMALETLDRTQVLSAVQSVTVELFNRRPMSDFEYLKSEIEPALWVLILTYVIWLLAMFGMSFFFHVNEFDNMVRRYRYVRR